MEGRADVALRWGRATLLGSLVVLLGAAGHASADGLLPGPGVILLLVVAAVLVCTPLVARPASARRLVGAMVAGQTAVHVALSLTAGHVAAVHGAHGAADGRVGTLQEAHDATHALTSGAPALPASLPASLPAGLLADLAAHAPMMVAHLLVAALVGLWLAVGERALWGFLALTGARLVLAVELLLAPVLHAPATGPAATSHAPRPRPALWRVRPVARRGPPLLLLG